MCGDGDMAWLGAFVPSGRGNREGIVMIVGLRGCGRHRRKPRHPVERP